MSIVYRYDYQSPLGCIVLAGTKKGLTGLWFEGQKYFGSTLPEGSVRLDDAALLPVFEKTVQWLDLYFQGEKPDFLPELYFDASPFRMAVWEILLAIPYGQTMTYGEIADILVRRCGTAGKTENDKTAVMSAQAVGGAVGHNPISIIVPCHRVLGAGKKLTGYAGGMERKQKLLELEGIWYCLG